MNPLQNSYDLLFLDPPYRQGLIEQMLLRFNQQKWLNPDAIIVIEASFSENLIISKDWHIENYRTCSTAALWIITKQKIKIKPD